MNAPSPQSSPPAGRGGVYLKIELKFQISLVRFYLYKSEKFSLTCCIVWLLVRAVTGGASDGCGKNKRSNRLLLQWPFKQVNVINPDRAFAVDDYIQFHIIRIFSLLQKERRFFC